MKKSVLPLFAVLIFSCGCARLDTTQELKRDGLMDIIVIFDSPYFTISDSVNASIIPNPLLNPVAERINNMLIYYFSDVNPSLTELFISINKSNDLRVNASGFFGSSTFKYNKEFKFPYYYYYYSADFGNISIGDNEDLNETALLEYLPSFDINYDIIYFGELVSTNGEEIDNKKIRFSLINKSNYELTFREFFLTNWLSRIIE